MTLPSFTITGTLFDLLGNVAAGEIVGNGLGGATPAKVTFTSNVPQGYFVTFGGVAFRVDEVEGIVNSDGTITRNGDPVQLLANDAGLSVDGLQWQCHVAGMHRFWFNAPVDGGTVNLGTVVPVPGLGVSGVAFSEGELVTLLADDGSSIRAALDAVIGKSADLAWIARHPGRPVPAARFDYRKHPDTAYASLPTTMDTGQTGVAYEDNGTNHPFIQDGAFQLPRGSGSGQAFEYTHVDAGVGNQLTRLAATFKIDPTGASTDTWAIGIAMANGPTLDYGGTAYRIGLHLSIGATQWGLSKVSNATGTKVFTFMTDVNGAQTAGFLQSPILEDDQAEYTVEMWRVGNTAVVILPDGQRIEVTDSDIGAWATRYGYVELVMVARDTDPFPKFTEAWYDANGITLPGQGGIVTREVLDANTKPKISWLRGLLGNIGLRIADNAGAVNYLTVSNRVAGSAPYLIVEGADADIPFEVYSKGNARAKADGSPIGLACSTDGTGSLPAPIGVGLEFVITAAGLDDIHFNGTSL